jgi:two-component system KDP operon response regulator KdpE
VIVLSAIADESSTVAALDAGADDYVTKPFAIDELRARLRAVIRRIPTRSAVVEVGELVVDLESRAVSVGGERVHLSPNEFRLLRVLALRPGRLHTRQELLQEVRGRGFGCQANLLHVYMCQLRRKLEPDRARPRYLLTEPHVGYRLALPGPEERR